LLLLLLFLLPHQPQQYLVLILHQIPSFNTQLIILFVSLRLLSFTIRYPLQISTYLSVLLFICILLLFLWWQDKDEDKLCAVCPGDGVSQEFSFIWGSLFVATLDIHIYQ
jgi:hypothetical protein